MERDDANNDRVLLNDSDERPRSAVNAAVLDYYKKFGRKRDLEQYFSLSTAQSEIRDPSSLFWRRMKEQSDTSDSGEKKSESSNEICRISIQCSIPRSNSQRDVSPAKSDSESPPIITDALPGPSQSGDDSVDDNHSQKSIDGTFESSMNKPLSPTSSVTSQRKLEWDSLADVGYGNESDRKTSASSLSTLEREVLAQKQQYTLNFKQNSDLGLPTAHSTPVDPNESKPKGKKGQGKKSMSFTKKDVDFVEVRVPHNSDNAQAINVNLTKQFSVNLEKDGGITVDNVRKDITVAPEKEVQTENIPQVKMDKEIQTSLLRSKEKVQSPEDHLKAASSLQKLPVYISLKTLKRRHNRKKIKTLKSKTKSKKRSSVRNESMQDKEKSAEQVSEAESFEYMPGHMYNQNQINEHPNIQINNVGNKSSLESSAVHTTDSSKESKYSFTKELNRSLDVLKSALKEKYDSKLKKKLINDIIQRLLKTNFGDDESTSDFNSVLRLYTKKTPTPSTSEGDNTGERVLHTKPKKSILRASKFNSNDIASTSQSAPNLPSAVTSEKLVLPYFPKQVSSTPTDTDISGNNSAKEVTSSDTIFAKTSSEDLYIKYIEALKKEEAYKQHLKDRELFLRQKLVRSNTALKVPAHLDIKTNTKLKELIKDLTRNNYDDGSGDASKLEGGSSSNFDLNNGHKFVRKQRSHSVFTLSSNNSDVQNRKFNSRNREHKEISVSPKAGPSHCMENNNCPGKKHACIQTNVMDSSEQVKTKCTDEPKEKTCTGIQKANVESIRTLQCIPPDLPDDVKYVCLCTEKSLASQHGPDEFLIYKCSRLTGHTPVIGMTSKASNTINVPCACKCTSPRKNSVTRADSSKRDDCKPKYCCLQESSSSDNVPLLRKWSRSSQTDVKLALNTLEQPQSARSTASSSSEQEIMQNDLSRKKSDIIVCNCAKTFSGKPQSNGRSKIIQECTRCLQTEISIHPMISDPSLTDINVVNSEECVKLISELYRKVSQSSSERNACQCSNSNDDADTNKFSKSSKDNINLREKQSRDNLSVDLKNIAPMTSQPIESGGGQSTLMTQSESISDNIVIPIQGTKMTLKVSIAGNSQDPNKIQMEKPCCKGSLSKGMATEGTKNVEKFTSITAECSKAVQSENIPDIFKDTAPNANIASKPCCSKKLNSENVLTSTIGKDLFTNLPQPSKPEEVLRSNTYPKVIDTNDRKPLLRCNTDPNSHLGTNKPIPIKNVDKSVKETQPIENKQDESNRMTSKLNDSPELRSMQSSETSTEHTVSEHSKSSSNRSSKLQDADKPASERTKLKSNMYCNMITNEGTSKDLILEMIQDITKRYSKQHEEKSSKKKKCFKEIMTVLNYLLDTDDSADGEQEPSKDSQSSKGCKTSNKQKHESIILSYREAQDTNAFIQGSPRHASINASIERTDKKIQNLNKKLALRSQISETKTQKTFKGAGCGSSNKSDAKEIHDHGDADNNSIIKLSTGTTSNSDSSKSVRLIQSSKQPTTTCDMGCGCDGSSECKEGECGHADNKTDKGKKQSLRSEKQYLMDEKLLLSSDKQETNDSCPKTCDKACGCDSPECQEKSESGSAKYETYRRDLEATEETKYKIEKPYSRCENKESCPKTCDIGCGCDDSSECKESSEWGSAKFKTDRSDKQTLRSKKQKSTEISPKKLVSKCVQSTAKKVKSMCSYRHDSSELPISTDQPSTSTDSPTARIINKIKKECEKYQKRSRPHCCKKIEVSSSTSASCDHCKRAQQCHCKGHKCRCHRTKTTMEKIKKKCVAYNLILQTSDSLVSEEPVFDKHCRPLQNIVVKVPKRKQEYVPFKEMSAKIEQNLPYSGPRCHHKNRSRSWPNESSTDDVKMAQACTVRDYLERNRPDFVERCTHRQNCIRMISESRPEVSPASPRLNMVVVHNPNCMGCTGPTTMYCGGVPMNYNCCDPCLQTVENEVTRIASERARQREVLSMRLGTMPTLTDDELRYLAKELGYGQRRSNPKIISEREMKKHSEKIYKSLPEVVRKKEDARKESIKKTNLLLASIFKKNLQKKALQGAVTLSNYSPVIKI